MGWLVSRRSHHAAGIVWILVVVCRRGTGYGLLLTPSQSLEFLGVLSFESFQGSSRGLEKGTGSLFRHVNNGSWRRRRYRSTAGSSRIARLGGLVLTEQ